MANDFAVSEYAALATFHDQLQRLMDASEQRAREVGLQRTKFRLLMAIKQCAGGAPATIGTLAAALDIDRNTVVEIVDDLIRQRLVVRERDRDDRRRALISLTAAGQEWLQPLVEGDLRELASAGPGLLRALRMVLAHAVAISDRSRTQVRADVGDFAWRATGSAPI